MDDRVFASATELAAEIRDRRIGCIELLDFYLARAERHNPALNAIVVRQVDQARERARAADAALARGERWGPLHGIPMTVKELFDVAGLPTTFGNPLWKDNIAAGNAFRGRSPAGGRRRHLRQDQRALHAGRRAEL